MKMTKTFRGDGWVAAGLAAAVTLPVAALPQYTVTELVAPPEASITDTPAQASASSLNDAGIIVGYGTAVGTDQNTEFVALAWLNPDAVATVMSLADPQTPGLRYAVPFEIGNGGHVVGFAYYPDEERTRAVRWENPGADGQSLALPTPDPDGFLINRATGVNSFGDAVGVGFRDSASPDYLDDQLALYWAAGSSDYAVLPALEMVDGGESSTTWTINDEGLIVGSSYASVPGDPDEYVSLPVAWVDQEVYALDVGRAWDDDLYGRAVDVTQDGRIIGTDGDHAILWQDYAAAPTFLGTLDSPLDEFRSTPLSINENGWIVGEIVLDTPGPGTEAYPTLWDPQGQAYDLNDLLAEDNPAGWIITDAREINNDGWILALGESADGQTSNALLLRPLELDGDYNGDGFVSQADLDLVLLNWGDAVVPAEWVATDQFDGVQVSQNELDGVLLNWGSGTPPAVPSFNAIPEPGVAGLVLAWWGGLMCRRPGGGD